MPVTEPPRNATLSAGPKPPRAASAVRTLARTETIMPMKPAAPDRIAPIRKPIAASLPSVGATQMTIARMTATMPTVRYCRCRNAMAPSWIAAAISRMRSLPAGCARTQNVRATP